jgi:uncharacterized protein YecE (DUF72 family)
MQDCYIGTSGWSYDHWQEFYTRQASATDRLKVYAQHFNSVELNSSFYHWPRSLLSKLVSSVARGSVKRQRHAD